MQPAIILRTNEQVERAIARIRAIRPDPDRPMGLWIGPYRKIRSLAQNAKYWARVRLVAQATGHSKSALHEYFKELAFGKVVEEIGGKMIEYTPSSAKADRGDFSDLIEHVEAFIAEHGIEDSA